MDDYEEEESDGLVHSSFTIPCSSSSSQSDTLKGAFPILSKYERTAKPSGYRRAGYLGVCKKARLAFENTLSYIFDPLIADLEKYCFQDQLATCTYYIPGSVEGSSAKRLSAAAIIGPQLSSTFDIRLRSLIQKRKSCTWATLTPRECTSLAATIRLLVARLTAQHSPLDHDTFNLSDLSKLTSTSTAFIHLPSIALHKYVVLNDLIKALHSCAQKPDFPRLILLFGMEGGVASLDDKIDTESFQLLDIHRFHTPSPSTAFEVLMQELFLHPTATPNIWLGSSTLEMLRYQYFERGFDLDQVLSTMELAYHHHFTTRPLSSVLALSPHFDCDDWEPVFYDRLRLQIVEAGVDDKISLPRPSSKQSTATSKQAYLQLLLKDDRALLTSMADFASAIESHRSDFRRAIHLLHTLRSHFLNQASDDSNEAVAGPRRTSLGGLAMYVLSERSVRGLVNGVNAALRRAPIGEVEAALSEVESSSWASDHAFQEQIRIFLEKIKVELQKEKEEETLDAGSLRGPERVEMVQRKLLREENCDAIKRSIAEWCGTVIQSSTRECPLLINIWTYDFSSYLTQLLDPSSRSSILAALNNPSAFISINNSEKPDICHLYQMYQSAGRMINLADWYQAFTQSIREKKATDNTAPPTKKRSREDDSSTKEKEAMQARFALAVWEMGKMGFLKKTRRKPDHVLKVVHDLPPVL